MSDLATRFSDLASAVALQVPRAIDDVVRLVAIPSVSSQPEHDADVEATAQAVADHLTDLGCPDVQIVREGGKPAVIGRFDGPTGAPRVCLYAHHDVQPVGDATIWETPGFEATRRGDRLFGRGAADDKGGIGVHLAALRAFRGDLPVGVTVFIEGEEEIGSPSLQSIIAAHSEQLRADAYVIADSGNWDVGVPAFTTSLRGVCDCVVEVATLDHAIHSGQYGGVLPDAVTSLCRLLATLHHEDGSVAVDGLVAAADSDLVYPEDRFRAESGVLDGVSYLGSGSITSRIWSQPAITVIGIDAPSVADASNTLFPKARAKVSLRVPPGQGASEALDRLVEHLESSCPLGCEGHRHPWQRRRSGRPARRGRDRRRRDRGVHRGVRGGAGPHGTGRLDPDGGRLPAPVPRRDDPADRCVRPRLAHARTQREPASRRLREGGSRRGAVPRHGGGADRPLNDGYSVASRKSACRGQAFTARFACPMWRVGSSPVGTTG
jgi:acetylornithine deacetylase/succinyl-diaminopimelate desuccinylase-like protein